MSMNCIEQIKAHEGYRQLPYHCTGKKLTIGYGFNLESGGISKEEAELILSMRIEGIRMRLANAVPWYANMVPARQAVFINMTYQMGFNGFKGFKRMLKHAQLCDYELAANEMLNSLWAKQTPERAKALALQMESGEWQ
ncbi:glycoside hydrolase family protein [Pseudoalteromonas luteoviolacea]|uniref:glycoside hydrolase family protein n=1 Tax=Pseudoalteromonas luteoviolacea TaxID=43657 RepID=UPI001EEDF887|nr:glycoside hydrolase family protein [Pseudoalteromonas luteoviolacea]MCF6442037.1 glycoside hydrolase family protein [Pseudoalteromonas luteoviolacea]